MQLTVPNKKKLIHVPTPAGEGKNGILPMYYSNIWDVCSAWFRCLFARHTYTHSYGKDGNFYLIFKLTPNSTINSQNDEDIIS